MRRSLVLALIVMLLSIAVTHGAALAAGPATSDMTPGQVAVEFLCAVRDERLGDAEKLVLPSLAGLPVHLKDSLRTRMPGWSQSDWSRVDVRVARVQPTGSPESSVLLTIGESLSVTVILSRDAQSDNAPWLISDYSVGLNYRVDHETLWIAVDPEQRTVQGNVSLDITMLTGDPSLSLLCYGGLKVTDAKCDGHPAKTRRGDTGSLIVTLPRAVTGPRVTVSYSFAGTIDDRESFTNRAYMDILPQGAYFGDVFGGTGVEADITVSVPEGWAVASGGTLEPRSDTSAADRVEFRFHRAANDGRLIMIGRYTTTAQDIQGIPVTWYLSPDHRGNPEAAIALTDRTLAFLINHVGPYQFDDLTIADIPTQHGGGTTANDTIMVVTRLKRNLSQADSWPGLVSHELAHLWWNRGTSAWCIEGLANYTVDWMTEESGDRQSLRERRAFERREFLRVPPDKDTPILRTASRYGSRWMPQIIYEKGALVFGMLHFEIGDEAFETVMREFASAQYRSPERLQFLAEQASGRDLEWFFHQWLETNERLDLSLEFASRAKLSDGYHTSFRIINKSRIEVPHIEVLIRTAAGDQLQVATLGPTGGLMGLVTPSPVTDVILDPDGRFLDVNLRNNVIGTGPFDRGSPMRPWTIGAVAALACAALGSAAVAMARQGDVRRVLPGVSAELALGYIRARGEPAEHELFMAAAKAYGAPTLAHNVQGAYPCAFGIYHGHLIVLRQPGEADIVSRLRIIRVGVHFRHDGAGFTIERRHVPARRRQSGGRGRAGATFDAGFEIKLEPGQAPPTLDERAKEAILRLGDDGAAGIRVTPYGAFYYASSRALSPQATAKVLDALVAVADSLTVGAV